VSKLPQASRRDFRIGKRNSRSNLTAVEVIVKMAGKFPDEEIAKTLNRQRQRTGSGHSWTAQRVAYTRKNHNLADLHESDPAEPTMTLQQTAKRLQVSAPAVRRLIARGCYRLDRLSIAPLGKSR